MFYRALLIAAIALLALNGCSQTQLAPYQGASHQGYSDNYPWVWEPSCNCWVNVALQNQPAPVAAPVAVRTPSPCAGVCNLRPARAPALVPCSASNSCQPDTPKPRLRLLQTSTQSSTPLPLAPVTAPVIATNTAANPTAPSYWDPNCQCWVTARYLNTSPTPNSAVATANEAKVMATQALKASGDTDEKLNRMYQRLIQK